MKIKALYFFISILWFLFACNSDKKPSEKSKNKENLQSNLDFKKVNGIRFYEVKRRFKNGLSFNKDGFQQEPTWIIEFKSPDSMLAYSPEINKMEAFYLQHDHGMVYNFAREFFRAKAITKDSLVLQRLQVNGKVIAGDDDVRSDVYCTFYSKRYVESVLKTTVKEIQKPTKQDTLFIKKLAQQTYKDPSNAALAFAARQPVSFLPNSKNVTVQKISTVDELNNRKSSVDYLYPKYKMTINKSYKNFAYYFSVIVDAKGKMYVNTVGGVLKEDIPSRKKLLQGITDVYLQNLFFIRPGSTLGIAHSSEITLNIVGKMAP